MDIFGPQWRSHSEKIAAAWRERIGPEDVVLLPGDISWGMKLADALVDLEWIDRLPGAHKVIIRGNHDYWWTTLRKMNRATPPSLEFIHNNALRFGRYVVAGTRGWDLRPSYAPVDVEGSEEFGDVEAAADPVDSQAIEEFEKISQREYDRLDRSLKMASQLGEGEETTVATLLHFPPLYEGMESSGYTDILDRYAPDFLLYGHLHGKEAHQAGFQGVRGETKYYLTSADFLDFRPLLLHPED